MINILFAARPSRWDLFKEPLEVAFKTEGLEVDLRTDHAPEEVDYILYAPNADLQDFTPYTRCKLVHNMWAGVERAAANETLTQPLCRLVDDEGLTQSMIEWVVAHTMRHHLDLDRHIKADAVKWDEDFSPLSNTRRVCIYGLGAIGQACAKALLALGFQVSGWSRNEKHVEGVTSYFGPAGFQQALQNTDISVLLLPDTPDTQNIFNAETFAQMPKGVVILNAGRGPLIKDDDLIKALDADQLGHATLDVFRVEPLPEGHVFYTHPKITITPHIAGGIRPDYAAKVFARNIRLAHQGEPVPHLVDRAAGY